MQVVEIEKANGLFELQLIVERKIGEIDRDFKLTIEHENGIIRINGVKCFGTVKWTTRAGSVTEVDIGAEVPFNSEDHPG